MIRDARKEDLDRIVELYGYLDPTSDFSNGDRLKETWDEILSNSKYFKCLVLEVDGEIVSSCIANIIPNITNGIKPYIIVENVITHPESQGKGYGKRIINHVIELGKKLGCYKVMLLSGSKRTGAHKFYEAIGFDSTSKKGFQYRLI